MNLRRTWYVMTHCTTDGVHLPPKTWSKHWTRRGAERSLADFNSLPAVTVWSGLIVNITEMDAYRQWVEAKR